MCVFIYFSSFITNTDIGPVYLFGWGIWWCMNLAIYFADRTVCLVVSLPTGAVVLLYLENAQFVVLLRAGFSLPALLVALPATPEAPQEGMKMWC